MGKKRNARPKLVTKLVDLAEESGEFDRIIYGGSSGCQPGVWIEVHQGDLEAQATIQRASCGSDGYGRTPERGSRISYLSINLGHWAGRGHMHYGSWDPRELSKSPKHNFEKDPKDVKDLSRLIVKYFSQ